MRLRQPASLEAIYTAQEGSLFLTGIQALVRLPIMQRQLDQRRGLNTAGLVSGYRGSPLGAYDQQLWKAKPWLDAHDVRFQPGLNEDLAATALWGAQMHRAFGPARVDGVFGIWYGKGNGVDRTGDVFRNANMLGTSQLGGVLAVAGDDHAAQSSMFPHQTDGIFRAVHMPVLQPASVGEILELGLAGIAMSRFAGVWVAMKTIAEVVESAGTIELPDLDRGFVTPNELAPAHGLNWDPTIQWPAQRAEYERRMIEERMPAAIGWASANSIDKPIWTAARKKLCIVTVGKAHQDLMQALNKLGIGNQEANALGLSIYKVAMTWPLASAPLLAFAGDAEEIFVVEEKAGMVEDQLKAALFNRQGNRPRVSGKSDSAGHRLLPEVLEFSPLIVAEALVSRLEDDPVGLHDRLSRWQALIPAKVIPLPARKPYFCSGCPHNTSTATPEGSISGGGIGCHVMALSVPKLKTTTFSQMGGEGLQWIGASSFSRTEHIFQNLGDGTYQHSGLLAIRAAIAAGTNITYKILYNDAVAMTGGQPAEGAIEPPRVVAQLLAEGVAEVRLVSDDPGRWRDLPGGIVAEHRDRMDVIQRELRERPGVTAIVYEQTCAAEKRRRRKRGEAPDPDRRLFINSWVCEGCGDCSVQSNCIAIQPLETTQGTKRKIDQSACNKDFSCTKGFCPSFVEVEGAKLRRPSQITIKAMEADRFATLAPPQLPAIDQVFSVYIAGIGGNGVLTLGALLGTAAHLDGLEATVLDFTGLAQKNGAVVSQVRIAPGDRPIHAARIGPGEADLLLAADSLVAASRDALVAFAAGKGALALNLDETPTADFVTDRDAKLPSRTIIDTLLKHAGTQAFPINATRIAEGLFGSSVAANTLLLGYAWQKGLVPISSAALEDAITSIGTAVEINLRAFYWGRVAADDIACVEIAAGLRTDHGSILGGQLAQPAIDAPVQTIVEHYANDLEDYQNSAYAARYLSLMQSVSVATAPLGARGEVLYRSLAISAYKVMAIKDEYEVARLHTQAAFSEALERQFEDWKSISVHLAPPLLSRTDPRTGRPAKRRFGAWVFPVMRWLARARGLRGTWADPFGHTAERRAERALREQFLLDVATMLPNLDTTTLDFALALAVLPGDVRGFGPIKLEALSRYAAARAQLFAEQGHALPAARHAARALAG